MNSVRPQGVGEQALQFFSACNHNICSDSVIGTNHCMGKRGFNLLQRRLLVNQPAVVVIKDDQGQLLLLARVIAGLSVICGDCQAVTEWH